MKPTKDPTPAEIAAECLLIQLPWSPDETLKRLRSDLRPMVRSADDRLVAVCAEDYDEHHRHGGAFLKTFLQKILAVPHWLTPQRSPRRGWGSGQRTSRYTTRYHDENPLIRWVCGRCGVDERPLIDTVSPQAASKIIMITHRLSY